MVIVTKDNLEMKKIRHFGTRAVSSLRLYYKDDNLIKNKDFCVNRRKYSGLNKKLTSYIFG